MVSTHQKQKPFRKFLSEIDEYLNELAIFKQVYQKTR